MNSGRYLILSLPPPRSRSGSSGFAVAGLAPEDRLKQRRSAVRVRGLKATASTAAATAATAADGISKVRKEEGRKSGGGGLARGEDAGAGEENRGGPWMEVGVRENVTR